MIPSSSQEAEVSKVERVLENGLYLFSSRLSAGESDQQNQRVCQTNIDLK